MKKLIFLGYLSLIIMPQHTFANQNSQKVEIRNSASKDYDSYLNSLQKGHYLSVKKAKDRLIELAKNSKNQDEKEELFKKFKKYFQEFEYDFDGHNYFFDMDSACYNRYKVWKHMLYHLNTGESIYDKYLTQDETYDYIHSGLELSNGEGVCYGFKSKYSFMFYVASLIGIEANPYDQLMSKNAYPLLYDGYLTASYEQLKKDIILFENFFKKYPEYDADNEAKHRLRFMLDFYMGTGMGSSFHEGRAVFETWKPYYIKPELKKSYELFLKENKESKYYPIVQDLHKKWSESNFKYHKETASYIRSIKH
jgi:hypothetical protein